MSAPRGPSIVVLSSAFPSSEYRHAGVFVQERMRFVEKSLPVSVVSPRPWFPLQSLIRRWRPSFRPSLPAFEVRAGLDVHRPRVVSVPGVLKQWDGFLMALGAYPRLRLLKMQGRLDVLDAHFAYPEGYAAALLGRWLGVPVTLTMRGTEARHARDPRLRPLLRAALEGATRVFAVSKALKRVAIGLGIPESKVLVVGNGVDSTVFHSMPRAIAREQLGIGAMAKVLVTVGGLVERKGFHRVIDCMPDLVREFPDLLYLIVGSAGPEGDWESRLREQVRALGVSERVRFLGAMPPDQLKIPLSAADLFVLSTRYEGWANVLLEAMACGTPIVATDVGGNCEVVSEPALGTIVPFDDHAALVDAIGSGLRRVWDHAAIERFALTQSWDDRARTLVEEYRRLVAGPRSDAGAQ